jgi:hypothetical protein
VQGSNPNTLTEVVLGITITLSIFKAISVAFITSAVFTAESLFDFHHRLGFGVSD